MTTTLPAGRDLDLRVAVAIGAMVPESLRFPDDPQMIADLADVGHPAAGLLAWYSEDMTAAMQAVEVYSRTRGHLNPFRLSQHLKGWCCRLRTSAHECVAADAPTPALAICRALLLAVADG